MINTPYEISSLAFSPQRGEFDVLGIEKYLSGMPYTSKFTGEMYCAKNPQLTTYIICNDDAHKSWCLTNIKQDVEGHPLYVCVIVNFTNASVLMHIGVTQEQLAPCRECIAWLLAHYQCTVKDGEYGRDFSAIVHKQGVNGLFKVTQTT